MRAPAFFTLDVVLVLVFAAVGRRSHAESGALVAVLLTAWPFLVGLAAGWGYALVRRMPPLSVRTTVPTWLLTVAVGHLLRIVTGPGTAISFIVVSLVALGLFLLLPRAVAGRA